MGVLSSARVNAVWQIAATLNLGSTSNNLLAILNAQPDGVYAEANMLEIANWLKWELGRDSSLAKWFPPEVYSSILAKFENFNYNKTAIGEAFLPPQNAVASSGQITCDEDPTGAARDVLCWAWDYADFEEQDTGTLTEGVWTFSGLSAGNYVLCYSDYLTAESFPTTFLGVS